MRLELPETWSWRDLVRVPGLLSLTRVVLAVAFPLTLRHAEPRWSIAVVCFAGASDVLDGWYARRFRQETATGAFLDAVADKLFVLSVALTLLLTGVLSPAALVLLGTRDLGEAALALRLTVAGQPLLSRPPNASGKLATLCQFVAVVAVLGHSPYRAIFLAVAGLAGLVAAATYWRREVARVREAS
jgi:CDP-diacylglycerol--glycerol-3-phosphate 3-phosphatidyltransferase/cardiolipin synthase